MAGHFRSKGGPQALTGFHRPVGLQPARVDAGLRIRSSPSAIVSARLSASGAAAGAGSNWLAVLASAEK